MKNFLNNFLLCVQRTATFCFEKKKTKKTVSLLICYLQNGVLWFNKKVDDFRNLPKKQKQIIIP